MSSDGPGQEMITSRPVLPPEAPPFRRTRSLFRIAGLAAGIGLVLWLGPLLFPASGPPSLPLTVNAEVARTGEVGPTNSAQALALTSVVPGADGSAQGGLELKSQTWVPVELTLQDTGESYASDGLLQLRVTLDGTVIHEGSRAELRDRPSAGVQLEPGQRAWLDITASLPEGADSTYQGRTTDITLTLTATRLEI